MKNMALDKAAKEYIIECISSDGYDVDIEMSVTTDKLRFLYDTFKAEYGWNIERIGEMAAFREWCMGLPSSFNIAFTNYDILQLAVKWGSIPAQFTDRQADKILSNYWNFMAVKTFQLFKKYKIGG